MGEEEDVPDDRQHGDRTTRTPLGACDVNVGQGREKEWRDQSSHRMIKPTRQEVENMGMGSEPLLAISVKEKEIQNSMAEVEHTRGRGKENVSDRWDISNSTAVEKSPLSRGAAETTSYQPNPRNHKSR